VIDIEKERRRKRRRKQFKKEGKGKINKYILKKKKDGLFRKALPISIQTALKVEGAKHADQ
jgi:hypothetical protein